MSPRRSFWAAWVALFLLGSAWVVAGPPMSSPDEPAHAAKAAAVVRGQFLGEGVPGQGYLRVELPYFYQYISAYPICYMFQPDVTADCGYPPAEAFDAPSIADTPAGRYNPLYYAVVGLPSFAPPGDGALYGMRLVSLALGVTFFALGMAALTELPGSGRRWAVAGAAVALTPMTIYLAASINPAGVEIAAAFALWCRLLVMLRHPDPGRDVSRMWTVALVTVFLANARGLSLLWGAMIVATVIAATSWRQVRRLLRNRRTWPAWAVIAVACAFAAVWVLATDTMSVTGEPVAPDITWPGAALIAVRFTDGYLMNMIGLFGWLDTSMATWVYVLWGAVFGVVTILAVAVARRREALTLLGAGAAAFAVPVLVQTSQAAALGIIWQGRYVLPFAIGVPLLAGFVLARRLDLPAPAPARAGVMVALAVGTIHGSGLVINLHRYVNGTEGSWVGLEPDAWLPPLPLPLVLALIAVAVTAWTGYLLAAGRADRPTRG